MADGCRRTAFAPRIDLFPGHLIGKRRSGGREREPEKQEELPTTRA
jgi:hypothetical protein